MVNIYGGVGCKSFKSWGMNIKKKKKGKEKKMGKWDIYDSLLKREVDFSSGLKMSDRKCFNALQMAAFLMLTGS